MTKTEAIKHFGSISDLAKALGTTYEAVRQWGDYIPVLRHYQIEVLSKGVLRAYKKPGA